MRLFVGIDVPSRIGLELSSLQPGAAADVAAILPRDMHVTLHFLGAHDVAAVGAALANVRAPRFSVAVVGLGQFRMRGGRRILWAGIEAPATLAALRAEVGDALAGLGFEAERRAYRPHVTLARLGSRVARERIDALLETCADRDFGRFEVTEFLLYDSANESVPYRYDRLRRYPLG